MQNRTGTKCIKMQNRTGTVCTNIGGKNEIKYKFCKRLCRHRC